MEKSKLGIPVTLVAAAAWLFGLYNGYLLTAILVGYVLLAEESVWLKKTCLKVLVLMLGFSVAFTVLDLLPNLLSILYSFLEIFNVHIYLSFVHDVFNFFSQILSLVKTLVFIALGITAVMGKSVKLPVIDNFVDKHLA